MEKPLIIIPAFNVENKIGDILNGMQEYRERLLIINDGSNDNTQDIIKNKGFMILNNTINKGVSFSVNKGIEWAKSRGFDKVIMMDSDGQHDPTFIPEFEDALNYYDLVCGNRFSNNIYLPSTKLASNMMAALLVDSIWKCKMNDVACGFKAFCLNKGIEDVISVEGRYSFVYDVLFYSLSQNFKIKSIDISAIYHSEELWYTRIEELCALLNSIERFADQGKLYRINIMDLKEKLFRKEDFTIKYSDYIFYGYFLNNRNGYIIQSEIKKMINHVNDES